MASTTRNVEQTMKVGDKVIIIRPDTAFKAARRKVFEEGGYYIPKDLRGKITIGLNANGDVVISAVKKKEKPLTNNQRRKQLIQKVIGLDQEIEYNEHQIPNLLNEIKTLKPTKKELSELQDLYDVYLY